MFGGSDGCRRSSRRRCFCNISSAATLTSRRELVRQWPSLFFLGSDLMVFFRWGGCFLSAYSREAVYGCLGCVRFVTSEYLCNIINNIYRSKGVSLLDFYCRLRRARASLRRGACGERAAPNGVLSAPSDTRVEAHGRDSWLPSRAAESRFFARVRSATSVSTRC